MSTTENKSQAKNPSWEGFLQHLSYFFHPEENPNQILPTSYVDDQKSLIAVGIFSVTTDNEIPSFEGTQSLGALLRSMEKRSIVLQDWKNPQVGQPLYLVEGNNLKQVGVTVQTEEGISCGIFENEDECLKDKDVLYVME